MKKYKYIWLVLFTIPLVLSCKDPDEYLDKPALSIYGEDVVWKDPNLVETFVNNMYRRNFSFPLQIGMLSSFVDESYFTAEWGITNFNKSLIDADNLYYWETTWNDPLRDPPEPTPLTLWWRWDYLYRQIRNTNIFFSKINDVNFPNTELKERLIGEVYYFRASAYHYLISLYGGAPIITKVYGLNEDFSEERNSFEECVNFIKGQLDSAALYLPDNVSTDGRLTKDIALAFKSRVLLYAASDLHNPEKNGELTAGYSHPEYLGYTTGSSVARWQDAKAAAWAVIQTGRYSLYKANPVPTDSVAKNFADYFLTTTPTSEDISVQLLVPGQDYDRWYINSIAIHSLPSGYHGWAQNTPLQELVDDFEMNDGTPFDWNNPVHAVNPYNNRDPRFYATVLYDGAEWSTRWPAEATLDPFNKIQTGTVVDKNNPEKVLVFGLDTRNSPTGSSDGTYSGYNLRKFVDPNIHPTSDRDRQTTLWRHIRYAEILMNYAEACAELGENGEAISYVNMIRHRAGMPELPASLEGDELKEAIRHERRIEFAYEQHRFFDVRRWMIGPQAYHQTHAIEVKYPAETTTDINDLSKFYVGDGERRDNYLRSDGTPWAQPVYKVVELGGDARDWKNKAYFFPIKRDELNKNQKLVQNPGY